MRIAAVSSVVFILLSIGYNKSTAQEIYQRTYGGALYQVGQAILETDDKGFLLGGNFRYENPIQTDVLLMKIDSMGNIQWEKTYGGNRYEYLNKLIKTMDGNYVGIGYTESFGLIGIGELGDTVRGDALIFKFDINGNILWSKAFGDSLKDYYFNILERPDGSFVICGYTNYYSSINNKADALVSCIDKDGNMKWSKKIRTSFDFFETGRNISPAPDGGIYISGTVSDDINYTYEDYFLLKADSMGFIIWSKVFNDSLSFFQQETITDAAGSIYYSYPTQGNPMYNDLNLIKMDSAGNYIWGTKFGNGTTGDDTPDSFIMLSNGNLLISSYNIILKVDTSSGALLKTTLVGFISIYNETIYSILEKSDKGVALLGTSGQPVKFLLSNIDSLETSCVPSSFVMPSQSVFVQPTDYYFADTLVTLIETNVSFTINDITIPDSMYCNTVTSASSLIANDNDLTTFPNPFHNIIQLRIKDNNVDIKQIEIRDMSGRTVFAIDRFQEFIDLSHLADGIYSITLSGNSFTVTRKIIKQ